jgi:hypothetical protein
MATQTSNPTGSPKIKDTTPTPPSQPGAEDGSQKLVNVPKREIDEKRKSES